MSVEIIPVTGIPEIRAGDDLPGILGRQLKEAGVRSRDIVAVTQKVVSKSEGMIVEEDGGKAQWVDREATRIVAQRGDLVIAETQHGFICANAGVDTSNVAEGYLTLLPEDPDASADRIRRKVLTRGNAQVGVIITDTFGRAWRRGLVDVAIGSAGIPALIDLRGTKDMQGRKLDSTVMAFADQVAAAAGLVMGKADGIPAAIVRGLKPSAKPSPARELVRPADEDLFRESPLSAVSGRRSIREFGDGPVPRQAVEEAVRAACTAPAPHHTRPWMFVALERGSARQRLLAAMARAWRNDLTGDGTPHEEIQRRIDRSNALLERAPLLIVPLVRLKGAHSYPDGDRIGAERQMFLLAAGAAIENLLVAFHSQGLATCWVSSTLFCKEETRQALGLDHEWIPLGSVAIGRPAAEAPGPRPALRIDEHLRWVAGDRVPEDPQPSSQDSPFQF
ncbi:MAG: coenzyme F420-0:L-glutamate ligase [Actinomycetota bacterium]